MNPYEILDVAPDAEAADIRTAFKKLSSKHHPDREHGDKDKMADVNAAYEILGDPSRRARYDQTGSTKREPSPRDRSLVLLAELMAAVVDHSEQEDALVYEDPLIKARKIAHKSIEEGQEIQAKLAKAAARRHKMVSRMLYEGEEGDPVRQMLHAAADEIEALIEKNQFEIAAARGVLDILADYDYRVDEKPPEPEVPGVFQINEEELQKARKIFGSSFKFY